MKYLKIASKGIIDIKSLYVVKSAKSNDETKIGMFGSGLKYSFSVLFRENIGFCLFAGEKLVDIRLKKDAFSWDTGEETKDIDFEQIVIEGIPTSFTPDSGPKWTLWMVIRELYSNALDQKEYVMEEAEEVEPIPGWTVYYIQINEALRKIIDNLGDYFSEHRNDLIFYSDRGKIFHHNLREMVFYRKGIRCSEKEQLAEFSYDLEDVNINESRIYTNRYDMQMKVVKLWSETTQPKDIQALLDCFKKYRSGYEVNAFVNYENYFVPNQAWFKFLEGKRVGAIEYAHLLGEEEIMIPLAFYKRLKKCGVKMINTSLDLDAAYVSSKDLLAQAKVKKTLAFFQEVNYPVVNVEVVAFADADLTAYSDPATQTIYINENACVSTRDIANIILREMARIKRTGETIQALSNDFLSYMERMNSLPL